MIANNHRYDAKNYRITELANEARIGVRNLWYCSDLTKLKWTQQSQRNAS
jgi:hypothetical protein